MKKAGYIALIVGFLSASYVAVLDPQITNWLWFLPAAALAAVGVVIIRQAHSSAQRDSTLMAGNRRELAESMANIVANLEKLEAGKTEIPPFEMRFEIDRLFREDLRRFADARKTLIGMYGMQTYADIVSDFAAGERYLNRVWSASADGYIDEVHTYVTRALNQFRHARGQLDAL